MKSPWSWEEDQGPRKAFNSATRRTLTAQLKRPCTYGYASIGLLLESAAIHWGQAPPRALNISGTSRSQRRLTDFHKRNLPYEQRGESTGGAMEPCSDCQALEGYYPHAALKYVSSRLKRMYGMSVRHIEHYECQKCGLKWKMKYSARANTAQWTRTPSRQTGPVGALPVSDSRLALTHYRK
jgi:hypothetical protein